MNESIRIKSSVLGRVLRVGAAVGALGILSGASVASGQPALAVRTEPVTAERVQAHRRVTGSLRAVSRSRVASQEPGQVAELLVDEGMTVEQGEVIARLDDRRLRSQVAEAEANVARLEGSLAEARAELTFAAFEHERVTGLHERTTASDRELREAARLAEVARARLDSAERAATQARRTLDLLRIRLGDMVVRAPYDAQVVRRHVDVGEWVEPGRAIFELTSTGTIEARLEVPERYAKAVRDHADRIFAEVAGLGHTRPSREVRVVADVDPRARTMAVILTLDNDDASLAPGMSVNAWIPTTGETTALTAPKDAVIQSGREAYVFRAAQDASGATVAQRTPVRVLFDWEDRLVLDAEGLAEGDLVVVEGNERMGPGQAVVLGAGIEGLRDQRIKGLRD